MKSGRFFLLLLALLFIACPAFAEGELQFHPPQTEAEKALDKILRFDIDKKLGEYFFNDFNEKTPADYPRYDPSKAKKYSRMFTNALQKTWQEAETKENFKLGKSIDEDVIVCMDFKPVFIALPVYRTIQSGVSSVFIEQSYPDDATKKFYPGYTRYPVNTYRIIKNHGTWKMDGIKCSDVYKFNMP